MELLDPAKNDESGGLSKRRISSILKAPRKSSRFYEPEEQENMVECVKPGEKKNSRRVSFAPADDVLLFSKDAKNTPVQSALQELTTPVTTQNRVQLKGSEDGIQQIKGMETLLNAPLQSSQGDEVTLDTENVFGEKTVMLPMDAASMDMTFSHTLDIANDVGFPHQTGNILNTIGDNTRYFADGESMDMTLNQTVNMTSGSELLSRGRNRDCGISQSVTGFDAGFANFLSSLKEKNGPDINPTVPRLTATAGAFPEATVETSGSQMKKTSHNVDKENKAPMFVPSTKEKSLNKARNIGELAYGNGQCLDEDVSMDMTEVQTGRIMEFTDDNDNPFQCLFPSQELYTRSNKTQQTALKTLPRLGSSDSKAKASRNRVQKVVSGERCLQFTDQTSVKVPSQHVSLESNFDTKDDLPERTVRFAADDAFLDMTQSHTVNIASASLAASDRKVAFFCDGGQDFFASSLKKQKQSSQALESPSSAEKCLDQGFKSFLASLSKPVGPSVNPGVVPTPPLAAKSSMVQLKKQGAEIDMNQLPNKAGVTVALSNQDPVFSQDDFNMDMTVAHTGCIRLTGTDNSAQSLFPSGEMHSARGNLKIETAASHELANVRLGFSNDKGLQIPTRDSLKKKMDANQVSFHHDNDLRDKTVRFLADDACMDVTQSRTVNIASHFEPKAHKNVDVFTTGGEKNVRFSQNDAAMDVKRSHTASISTCFEPQLHTDVDFLPTDEKKIVRFSADDAAMDVTRGHTENILTNFIQPEHQNAEGVLSYEDKTVRFSADDACMDVTQSHTVNAAAHFKLQANQKEELLPTGGEKTVRFSTNDASMDVARSPTVTIYTHVEPQYRQSFNFPNGGEKTVRFTTDDAAMDVAQSHSVNISTHFEPQQQQNVDLLPAGGEKNMKFSSNEASMDVTKCVSSPHNPHRSPDHVRKTDSSHQNNEVQALSNLDAVEMSNSFESNETQAEREPELRNVTSPLSQKLNSSCALDDKDSPSSCKSRRISLADLQSKVRRLSHMIKAAPDTNAMDGYTVPLAHLDQDVEKNTGQTLDKPRSPPVVEPELEDEAQAECLQDGPQPSNSTTPFKPKTQDLMLTLSTGRFKPKLPQRSRICLPKESGSGWVNSAGKDVGTPINVTGQLCNLDHNVSDINDEELGSYEDLSQTIDAKNPQKITENVCPRLEINLDKSSEESGSEEDSFSALQGKRSSVEDQDMGDVKRMKASHETTTDIVEKEILSDGMELKCTMNITPNMMTTPLDSSSSARYVSSRCETTLESSYKQSFLESQLEDHISDVQKRLEDGGLTVLEFFKVFNIDFVIHNPRQSVLPGKPLSDTDCSSEDTLKDRHITLPRIQVYEADVANLTQKVEGLKIQIQDLDKPLKLFNRVLWEELKKSSEKELKSLGAKLKERNHVYRKMSKAQSHEMKEALYINLLQANLEEQQKLRGAIEEADDAIRGLDDCISKLETELEAFECRESDDKPSLKSLEEDLMVVTETVAENNRQISELDIQGKHNSSKLKGLKTETKNLVRQLNTLNMVNEWKFLEKKANYTAFTFLHETLLLLVHENTTDNADNKPDQKISDITFQFQLDDKNSQCHAHLVHKLLSSYINAETSWVERYPKRSHTSKLLHDISLVVSRCRLLGEEVRLLKMWGGLRLDILDISCLDTQIYIVFSSLKKVAKFEIILSVSMANRNCVLELQSFKNIIGNTRSQQIEEIVLSSRPAKRLLTKIVKKIHNDLLC